LKLYLGPGLGALLYEIGGFQLPFLIVGSIGILVGIALIFVIPSIQLDKKKSDGAKTLTYFEIVKVFNTFLYSLIHVDAIYDYEIFAVHLLCYKKRPVRQIVR